MSWFLQGFILNNKLNISEIVFIAIVAAILGVIWWGYTFIYNILEPLTKIIAINGLFTGVWLMGGVFFSYIVRKPFAGFFGEVTAAVIQGFISQWGISSLIYGIVQGLACEVIFYLFGYKKWNIFVVSLSGMFSALCSFVLTYFLYQYYQLSTTFQLLQFICNMLSGIIFGGILSKYIADKLVKARVLNNFNIVKNEINK